MADEQSSRPAEPRPGARPAPPKVLPWLLIYTVGRLGIWAAARR